MMERPTWQRWSGTVVDLAVVAGLAAVTAALRLPAFGPSTLWLDDAWPALVSRAETWSDVTTIMVTAPGFTTMLWAWLEALGFSERNAQLLPLLLAVVTPPLLFLGLRRLASMGPAAAALAAVTVAVAPGHVAYATRVKPYTLDALLVTVLVVVTLWVLRGTADGRRWAVLGTVAVAAFVLSAAVAPAVGGAVATALLAALLAGAAERRHAIATAAVSATAAVLWWILVLRHTIPPGLRDFWAFMYLPLDDPATARRVFAEGVVTLLTTFSPLPWPLTLVAVLAALVTVARTRPRVLPLFVAPPAIALVLALAQLAPWGGGRTDIYLTPVAATLLAVAIRGIRPSQPLLAPAVAGLLAVGVTAVGLARPAPAYPPYDVAPLIEHVEQRAAPGDLVLLYPATRWAYALYGPAPVRLVDDPSSPTGFEVAIEDPAVVVLPPHQDEPRRYREPLADAVAGRSHVWFLASHWREDLSALDRMLAELGFEVVEQHDRVGARLRLLRRSTLRS